MRQIELPEEKIQQLAEQYAMEGAEKAIREYYTGYNSPYMKMMEEHLKAIAPNPRFDLPDLTAAINKALADKITDLANQVVAKTYIPLFNSLLTPCKENVVSTANLFQEFGDYIKDREDDDFDSEELEFEAKHGSYGLHSLLFKYKGETEFDLSIWERGYNEKGDQLYIISRLPGTSSWDHLSNKARMMKITLKEGDTAEVPIIDDVLSNDFMAYCAKLLICKTKIEIDNYPEWHDYSE